MWNTDGCKCIECYSWSHSLLGAAVYCHCPESQESTVPMSLARKDEHSVDCDLFPEHSGNDMHSLYLQLKTHWNQLLYLTLNTSQTHGIINRKKIVFTEIISLYLHVTLKVSLQTTKKSIWAYMIHISSLARAETYLCSAHHSHQILAAILPF